VEAQPPPGFISREKVSEADMSEAAPALTASTDIQKKGTITTITRLVRYTAVRFVSLFVALLIGLYLTILIANMGGYVDDIRRGEIRERVQQAVLLDRNLRQLPSDERAKRQEEMIQLEEKRLGLNQPFALRSFGFLKDALTLNLGRSLQITSASGSRQVRLILLERLPTTLALFGTVGFVLFFVEIFIALGLSRNYGSWLDRLFVGLAPTISSAPGWFYGIFLILIFSASLRWLPFGGMVDAPPPEELSLYFLSLLKHMILPATALVLSGLFSSVYNWRTFFLIYSSEDYVDVAKAKGLTDRSIESRYILRPTLPNIITNFAFFLMYSWTGAPVFESVFQWPGLGRITFQAVGLYDTPVILGSTVIFAYLLAVTVFLLDFIYALVDPRVKVGG
jgi:peptide/nickel transport system permease protein